MQDNFLLPVSQLSEEKKSTLIHWLVENVENGLSSPLDTYTMLRFYADAFEQASKRIEALTAEELAKYGKEKPVIGAYQVSTRNGGNTYKYDHDSIWNELKGKLSEREAQMKSIADFSVISFDENGIEIPAAIKVPKKDSIVITKKPK
jgi:hypothetical protein